MKAHARTTSSAARGRTSERRRIWGTCNSKAHCPSKSDYFPLAMQQSHCSHSSDLICTDCFWINLQDCLDVRIQIEEDPNCAMKFTHDLKFNKAPDWKDHYIDYWHLKNLIYNNEKTAAVAQRTVSSDPERQHLLSPGSTGRSASLLLLIFCKYYANTLLIQRSLGSFCTWPVLHLGTTWLSIALLQDWFTAAAS